MKKSIIFFAALAALFSCTKENPVAETPAEETFSVELFASAPAPADTKTTLVDGGVDAEGKPIKFVHWSKGDAIKVLLFPNRSNGNVITGPSGVFTSHFEEASSAEAFFRTDSWSWAGTPHDMMNDQRKNRLASTGVAVYPSTATAYSNKTTSSTSAALTSEISFVLPEEQNAVAGNIESGLNFSYADVNRDLFINTVDNGAKTELYFNNACALIQLTMPAEMPKVTSISITSNDKVALTGKGSLNLNYYQDVVEGGVTVTEGAGVVLNSSTGFEAGKTYYAVVWPGKHSALTIEFTAEDGSVATKTTDAVTLTASKVKPYTFSKGLEFVAPVKEFNYFYADGSTGNEVNSNIVGVVIFRGNPKTQFNDPDLPDKYCNGLAISVKTYSTKWHTSQPSTSNGNIKISSNVNLPSYNKGGYTVKNIWASEGISLNIYNASNYDALNGNTSGWYHGTPLEWKYICEYLSKINTLLSQVPGAVQIAPSNNAEYALPLYYYGTKNWTFYINGGAPAYKAYGYNFTSSAQTVRPIFAF